MKNNTETTKKNKERQKKRQENQSLANEIGFINSMLIVVNFW